MVQSSTCHVGFMRIYDFILICWIMLQYAVNCHECFSELVCHSTSANIGRLENQASTINWGEPNSQMRCSLCSTQDRQVIYGVGQIMPHYNVCLVTSCNQGANHKCRFCSEGTINSKQRKTRQPPRSCPNWSWRLGELSCGSN